MENYKHDSKVMCLQVSSCTKSMLSGCADGTVWLWNLQSGEFVRYFDIIKNIKKNTYLSSFPDFNIKNYTIKLINFCNFHTVPMDYFYKH